MARLGEMLVGEGVITSVQLHDALDHQKKEGGLLGGVLIARGFVSEAALVDVLSRQTGTPVVDLERTPPEPALAKVIPEAKARKIGCVPVKLNAHVLHVEDEAGDAVQHLGRGTAGVAVEAPDGPAGGGIAAVGDVGVGVAADAVLGGKDRLEAHARRRSQEVDGAPSARVDPGVVRDEADGLAPERGEAAVGQHVEARADGRAAARAPGGDRCAGG
jgi:hypothetical protein